MRWQLRSDIACGFLMPGEPVDVEMLSRKFSATRDQVLSSIVQLEQEGLICIHPQQGIFVSRLSISELMAMLELLAELEGACARLATQRLTPADAASLRNSTCGGSAGDVLSYSRANAMFHEVLYRACRNPALTAEIARVRARTQVYRRSPFEAPARVRHSFTEHNEVMRAVLAGNPADVRDRMVDPILLGAQELADHLSRTSGVLLGCDVDDPGRRDWFAERRSQVPAAAATPAQGIAGIVGGLIAARMLVGWSFPMRIGTSPSIAQRAAW